MGYLNYEFFDEFKALDNLCRDIYGESVEKKLGVTLYLEDMDQKAYQGAVIISGWTSDYNHLKSARNMRNELAHSRNSITIDICSQEDIDFVRSFRMRILDQTDPIAMLRKQNIQSRPVSTLKHTEHELSTCNQSATSKTSTGCLGLAILFLVVFSLVIAFLCAVKL